MQQDHIINYRRAKKGVITFSTGNCGRAVAYMGTTLGTKAVVCLSERVPQYRVESIKAVGGKVEQKGASQDEAEQHYYNLIKEHGYIPISPFDDPEVIAGQGTIALEMLTAEPEIDTILIQISGGGLAAGIAVCAKAINPKIRIIGVSVEQSPAMLESIKAGKPVEIEEKETLADSLSGGIGVENNYTLPILTELVDEHILISEDEIKDGMAFAMREHSLVIEGASAVGIAGLLHKKIDSKGKNIGLVLSGSSVNMPQYLGILNEKIKQE